MEKYFEKLRTHIAENPRDFGDGKSVLTMLYEAYAESNKIFAIMQNTVIHITACSSLCPVANHNA